MIFQVITKNCAGAFPDPRLPQHSACMISVKAPSNCLRYEAWLSFCSLNRWLDTSQAPNKVWEIYSLQLRNATSLKKKNSLSNPRRGNTHRRDCQRLTNLEICICAGRPQELSMKTSYVNPPTTASHLRTAPQGLWPSACLAWNSWFVPVFLTKWNQPLNSHTPSRWTMCELSVNLKFSVWI